MQARIEFGGRYAWEELLGVGAASEVWRGNAPGSLTSRWL